MKLVKDYQGNAVVFKIVVIVLFFLLISRLFFLQVSQGKSYEEISRRNKTKQERIEAPRGRIFDRAGIILAENNIGYNLIYHNGRKQDAKVIKELSSILERSEEDIAKKIKYGYIIPYSSDNILIEGIDIELAHKLKELQDDYPYISLQSYGKRNYPNKDNLSHVLGYVKKISKKEYDEEKLSSGENPYLQISLIGKNGVEKEYEEELRGVPGVRNISVDVYNKFVSENDRINPDPGKDLYLTIDFNLQKEMENYFESKGINGSFIALNPKNGEIVTAVSYPNYPLNKMSSRLSSEDWVLIRDDENKPLNNRLIQSQYPPGSVYKVVPALELLNQSWFNPKQGYYDRGYYQLGNQRWHPWKRGGHGYVNLEKSLVESANTYYYELGLKLGNELLNEAGHELGVGVLTGIDLPSERSGVNPSSKWKEERYDKDWRLGDTVNMSIGQGYVLMTPLQVANMYSYIANKGYSYSPRVVDYLVSSGKKEHLSSEKKVTDRYSESQYDEIHNALIRTVEAPRGTAKRLQTRGVSVAAKTGTAQNSGFDDNHAWIAGFFPAENPEIVFVGFVEGGGGGGSVAGPIAKEFIDKYRLTDLASPAVMVEVEAPSVNESDTINNSNNLNSGNNENSENNTANN